MQFIIVLVSKTYILKHACTLIYTFMRYFLKYRLRIYCCADFTVMHLLADDIFAYILLKNPKGSKDLGKTLITIFNCADSIQ